MTRPLVSIIIPVYNVDKYIKRALESIPKRNDIELIITNDFSNDNSEMIIEEFIESFGEYFYQVNVINHKFNKGVGQSKNEAYKLTTGEYLYTLDGDDYLYTDIFNLLLDDLKTKYKNYDIIRVDNKVNSGEIEHLKHTSGWSYILKNNFKFIDYPVTRKAEDWLFWLELKKYTNKIINTNICCYHYNNPRENSLVYQQKEGLVDDYGIRSDILLSIMIPVYNQEKLVIKALNSIPKMKEIEIIIIDDNSTDNSYSVILNWALENRNNFNKIIVGRNKNNMGCGFSKNWAYTNSQGKYIITIDSDDFVYTEKYKDIILKLNNIDKDMIYIGNDINSGAKWSGSDRKATWSYFIRNRFLKEKQLNYSKLARRAGDLELTNLIKASGAKEMIIRDIVYHYNYPREGSIVWNYQNGGK